MAIDDVVSDFNNDIANGSTFTVQPASGDEWHLTGFLSEASPGWSVLPHTDSGAFQNGLWGGQTSADDDLRSPGVHPLSLFLTNSEYIRLSNGVGSTRNCGFSAIKSKE